MTGLSYTHYAADASAFLGEMSRRKLQQVAESSDTLRRCVLIHNIMRSTAQHLAFMASQPTQDDEDDYEEELAYREAMSVSQGTGSSDAGRTKRTASSSGEQDWLDSILDDLEGDVHVSILPADDDNIQTDNSDSDDPISPPTSTSVSLTATSYPIFPFSVSSPPSSPPQRPTSPRFIPIPADVDLDLFLREPPQSPPGLDADILDSDEDDDDDDDGVGPYGLDSSDDFSDEVETPSNSTEFPSAAVSVTSDSTSPSEREQEDTHCGMFFDHLPFNRPLCNARHFERPIHI